MSFFTWKVKFNVCLFNISFCIQKTNTSLICFWSQIEERAIYLQMSSKATREKGLISVLSVLRPSKRRSNLPSIHARIGLRPIDIASSYWCWPFLFVCFRMVVSQYWENWADGFYRCITTRGLWRIERVRTLKQTPAVVSTFCDDIHLFICIL